MGEVGNESGGVQEENEGGEGDDNDEEEGEEERLGTGRAAARPASSMEAMEGQGERQNAMGKVKYY
jgi:hypothetical protein